MLAAVTSIRSDDTASLEALLDELVSDHAPRDIALVGISMTAAVLNMVGSEGDALLRELAKWVAESG
jgi:predicted alpha/beta-fold hydrolase